MSNPKTRSLLKRGVAEVIVESELLKMLESGRKLRLKQGFDPSSSDIHMGHVVGLRKLRQFQEMGHQVILIVGDWTAQIGDPSGVSITRPMLTHEQVKANAETYMEQFFKIVDKDKTQVRWQSEWYGNFALSDVIKLTSRFTVAQLLARDDFNKRYNAGRPIAITEFLYPLLQAYDSVVIESDVEFGGIDQKFNCLLGRELQMMMGQHQQQVLMVPLLVGTDGAKKMSKSLNNYIGVSEPPTDIYGKVMSIPDSLIMLYFELITDVSEEELKEFRLQLETQSINPMLLKKRLAKEIVTQFHGREAARLAEEAFAKVFQRRDIPEDMLEVSLQELRVLASKKWNEIAMRSKGIEKPKEDEKLEAFFNELGDDKGNKQYTVSMSLLLTEKGIITSRSKVKQLIAQNAVKIIREDRSKETVHDDRPFIRVGDVIEVGSKRCFIRIVDNK